MDLRVLKYFVTVAREESIIKASEFLNITQPTLSRQIMELEKELNVTLFARGNRKHKIVLTPEGTLLRKRAEEILELSDRTEAEIKSSDNIISGDVYIGGGETHAMHIMAKTALKLQKKYKNIRYHIFSGNADDVSELLDKSLLDFGILIEPYDIEKYEYIKLPEVDTWGLLMRDDSPLAKKTSIKAKDLENIPIITSRQTLVENQIYGWKGVDVKKLNIVATYNLIYNASVMVDEGFGYALCLDKIINTGGKSNLCFRPLKPALEANLNIVWKKHRVFSKAAKKFLDTLKKEIEINKK